MQWAATRYTCNVEIDGNTVTLTASFTAKGKWRGQAVVWFNDSGTGAVIASCTLPDLGRCRGEIERLAREKLK